MEAGAIYDRITMDEAKEILQSISAYSVCDLIKIYLHIASRHDQYSILRKCFDDSDYNSVAKDIVIESILRELYALPKEKAVTSINNNLNYYKMRKELRFG